jgi:hypothetical protein
MSGHDDVDRPAPTWKYAYVAAAIDFGGNFAMMITTSEGSAVGYFIQPQLRITNTSQTALGFIAEFCDQHEIDTQLSENRGSYRVAIGKRDDLTKMLKLVRPYVVAKHNAVEIMLKNLLPGLELGKASSKEGFVQLMQYVDQIREDTPTRSEPKYTEDYFREEWDL